MASFLDNQTLWYSTRDTHEYKANNRNFYQNIWCQWRTLTAKVLEVSSPFAAKYQMEVVFFVCAIILKHYLKWFQLQCSPENCTMRINSWTDEICWKQCVKFNDFFFPNPTVMIPSLSATTLLVLLFLTVCL